jgi:hypothetical protein
MRDGDKRVVVPICLLKDNYKLPAQVGWEEYHLPITQWDDEMWDAAFDRLPQPARQAQGGTR